MNKNKTIAIVINEDQARWLDAMAKLNNRSKSFLVRLAIDKLIELTEVFD